MRFTTTLCLLALFIPGLALSKSEIVRIHIDDGGIPVTVESRNLDRQFTIWSGPNTSSPKTGARDFADWSAGIVTAPAVGLARAKVTFFCAEGAGRVAQPCQIVHYVFDPAAARGYVYLPGAGEDGYQLNVRHLYRAVEGHWFHATPQWEAVMRAISVPNARSAAT